MEKSLHERKHLYSPTCMTSFGIPENTWKKGGLEPPCWHDVVLRRKDKIKLAQCDISYKIGLCWPCGKGYGKESNQCKISQQRETG